MTVAEYKEVEKVRSYEKVVQQFVSLIASGQLKPGDRLLPERELAIKFSISRAVLREAFRVMESLGIIESRIGSGRYLQKADVNLFGLNEGQEHLALYLSFMEARSYIEAGTVELAARRATREDLEKIERAVSVEINRENFIECDTNFHLAITSAAHNSVLEWIMGSQLFSIYFTGVWGAGDPNRWKHISKEHFAIYEAIKRKDAEEAKKAIFHHLERVKDNIIKVNITKITPGSGNTFM